MPTTRLVALPAALAVAGLSACGSPGASHTAAKPTAIVNSLFTGGTEQVETPAGVIAVSGPIGEKYADLGGREGELGMPESAAQNAPQGGRAQEFDGGVIYWSERTGAHVLWGEIRNTWEQRGGAGGWLGYPTGDEHDVTGGKEAAFEGGRITWIDGQTNTYPK